jgi:hypothetical protein
MSNSPKIQLPLRIDRKRKVFGGRRTIKVAIPIVPKPDRFRLQIHSITIIRRPFCWKYTLQHFFRISKVITAAKKQTNTSTTMAKKSVPPFSPLPTQLTHLQNKHELPLHHNLRIQHQYLLQLPHTPRPANHTFRRPIPLLPNRNLRHPPRTSTPATQNTSSSPSVPSASP